MPDQSLLPHYATGQIVPQGPSAERADTALSQLGNVSMLVIAAIDETYGMAEAYCQQGTRTAGQQKRLLERTALVLSHFDQAAIRVQGTAFAAILNRRWDEPPPAPRIIEVEVPQKGLIPRVFGK
jgi:hypothetical protein